MPLFHSPHRRGAVSYVFIGIPLAFVVAILIIFGPALYEKFIDIRYRFQSLETKVESLGQVQTATIVEYQKARGDAAFTVMTTQSPFNEAGRWEHIGGSGVF